MKSIDELTKYFGFYKSNSDFESFLNSNLIEPSKYDSEFLTINCKKTDLEIGFTNERMIRDGDEEKNLSGGKPIFTHFFIFPKSIKMFNKLPYSVDFGDNLEQIAQKAGTPNKVIETDNSFFGKTKRFHYNLNKYKVVFEYNFDEKKLTQITVEQIEKYIIEESKPAYNKV